MDIWVDEIEGWDQRPFSGGYAALRDLADASFSGAVSSGAAWLLFVNGRVVSVGQYRQGPAGASFESADIERFDSGEGTVYEAPHPSVPLLVAMQLADGETRGRYYTEQTPIAEVDETLTSGGFTGYLELSENVLSGDYYTVYQAGRSMDLGFVGNSRRLETEEDARETARDEVGIYEVVAVDLDVTPIPNADGTAAAPGAGAAATGAAGTAESGADVDGPEPTPADEPDPEPADRTEARSTPDWASGDLTAAPGSEATASDGEASVAPGGDASTVADDPDGGTDDGGNTAAPASDGVDESEEEEPAHDRETPVESATTQVDGAESTAEPGGDDAAEPVAGATVGGDQSADEGSAGRDEPDDAAGTAVSNVSAAPIGAGTDGDGVAASGSPTERLASRSVPSLDPARSDDGGGTEPSGGRRDRPGEREATASDRSAGGGATGDPTDASDEELAALREELAATEATLEEAETVRDEARERVAELESALERVETERDDLREEVDRLRDQVAELESRVGGTGSGPSLSAAEALAGTNLFVRYRSKGKTTVEDVHDGVGTPEDLDANLTVTSHTQFETEGATVGGEPFDEWLAGTQQYRFAEWLVSRFVFEVRDTGSADRMPDVYDALPEIDRIEFDGSVTVPDGEDELEVGFDVVCRDRMGDPLVVADLDASREPVGEAAMATLVQDAVGVCRAERSLAAAFSVTAAFFESEALETAADATDSSLLSRDSRVSYVKESRKRGFHLALVESRDGDFHLAVPDL